MPKIQTDSKIVIHDDTQPTVALIREALDLAVQQGAPSDASVKLQSTVEGWAMVVHWKPQLTASQTPS